MSDTGRPQRQFRVARAKFDPAQADRQGNVTRLAIERLGAVTAITFLNTPDATTNRRPLDVAALSDEGMREIIAVLDAPLRAIASGA